MGEWGKWWKKSRAERCKMQGFMFVKLLKECGKKKNLSEGMRLHDVILERSLLEKSPYIGNTLISMYAKCGVLPKARAVFDMLSVRDVISWNSVMAGYMDHDLAEEVMECLEQMILECIAPNAITFVCILKGCGILGAVGMGTKIYGEIASKGISDRNPFVGNALVNMYAKCGLLHKAQEVFNIIQVRDVVAWTIVIASYAENDLYEEALASLEQMQFEGISPNAFTYVSILKACGMIGGATKGKELHARIAKEIVLEKNNILGTALVDMYAKCGMVSKAHRVFDELPVRDVVSWTALVAGYTQHGLGEEALQCFQQMNCEGVSPNAVTLSCIRMCK